MRRATLLVMASAVTIVAIYAATAIAVACTIDGKATAFANHKLAVLTRGKLTTASVPTWAPFSFPGRYRAGATITLTEDQAQLRRVLPPEATTTHRAWRWEFGDGTHATGWTVSHRYAHPGTYRISVDAYYPSWHQYFSFDLVRIVVSSR